MTSIFNPFRPLQTGDDDGSMPLTAADIREIAAHHAHHRATIRAFNAIFSGQSQMTELLPCPFCGTRLVKSDTFSNRMTTVMIHDDTNDGDPCILRGTVISMSDRPEDVDRIQRWNRRADTALAAVHAYRKAVDAGVNGDPALWADAELKSRAAIGRDSARMVPTFRTEFPRFDAATLPELPAGFVDSSWHNDVCPSFQDHARRLQVFIDYVDPEEREFQKSQRFRLQRLNEHGEIVDHVMASDDWAEVLTAIENADIARAFRDILREQATPAQWEKMRADNAAESVSYICHSHDFCDANMAMIEAFERVLGRFDGDNVARMNRVWNFAKAAYLSEEPK